MNRTKICPNSIQNLKPVFQTILVFHWATLGSCGWHRHAHVIHNAFQKGVEATDWQVNSLLKQNMVWWLWWSCWNRGWLCWSCWNKRCDDYDEAVGTEDDYVEAVGTNGVMIMMKLLEQRMIMLKLLEQTVWWLWWSCWNRGWLCWSCWNKRCDDYDEAVGTEDEPLSCLAKEVTPFPTKYQCNTPMVAFLASDFNSFYRRT